jgi:hypothetical protein
VGSAGAAVVVGMLPQQQCQLWGTKFDVHVYVVACCFPEHMEQLWQQFLQDMKNRQEMLCKCMCVCMCVCVCVCVCVAVQPAF